MNEFTLSLNPGDYRFTSGGRDGASLDNQLVTITSTFHISTVGEILLGAIGILLMIGAIEMIYPIELFWKKYISNHNSVDYPPRRLIEEPVFSRQFVAATKCRSCGAEIRAEGLPPSFGGYNVYCVTCGAQFRVD